MPQHVAGGNHDCLYGVSILGPPPHEGEEFAGWALNGDEENLYDAGTEIGTDKADDDYTVRLKAIYKEPAVPTAVLYKDGTMIFYEGNPDPADETAHSGIIKSYTGWDTEEYIGFFDTPWYGNADQIITVQFKGTVRAVSTAHWFDSLKKMETFNPKGLDMSTTTNMDGMFSSCFKLSDIGDIHDWDVSNVTSMDMTFDGLFSLKSLDLSNWNVENVKNMYAMFSQSKFEELNLSNWNPRNVTRVEHMFGSIAVDSKKTLPPCKIYAKDWTSIANIRRTLGVFYEANVPNFNPDKDAGDMCKPQSMGGYFTDPQ